MYCPNCGNKNSANQKFCRSCGLGLEKVVQSLNEQLPTKFNESLQQRAAKLERLGVAALSVFGLSILGFIVYGVFYKLMLTQGKIIAGLGTLAAIFIVGCGLLSVILFAMANERKEAATKRRVDGPESLKPDPETRDLLTEATPQPVFSVADRTTELLSTEKKKSPDESSTRGTLGDYE